LRRPDRKLSGQRFATNPGPVAGVRDTTMGGVGDRPAPDRSHAASRALSCRIHRIGVDGLAALVPVLAKAVLNCRLAAMISELPDVWIEDPRAGDGALGVGDDCLPGPA